MRGRLAASYSFFLGAIQALARKANRTAPPLDAGGPRTISAVVHHVPRSSGSRHPPGPDRRGAAHGPPQTTTAETAARTAPHRKQPAGGRAQQRAGRRTGQGSTAPGAVAREAEASGGGDTRPGCDTHSTSHRRRRRTRRAPTDRGTREAPRQRSRPPHKHRLNKISVLLRAARKRRPEQ